MTNSGFTLTAPGVRFCSVLNKTENHFHLGHTTKQEQRSGCCLDCLQPGYKGESVTGSTEPSSASKETGYRQHIGLPGGYMASPAVPSRAACHPSAWSGHWAAVGDPLSITKITPGWDGGSGNGAGASIEVPIDWHDAMVGDVKKYTWKVTNMLGPLCWQAQIFFLQ